MSARMVSVVSSGKRPETVDLECECGERTDELEECWECGLALCSECARVRIVDGHEVVYCPMCAPALNPQGDE